jgi:hypothetical protein
LGKFNLRILCLPDDLIDLILGFCRQQWFRIGGQQFAFRHPDSTAAPTNICRADWWIV